MDIHKLLERVGGEIGWIDPDGKECILKIVKKAPGYAGFYRGSRTPDFQPSEYDEAFYSAILSAHSRVTQEDVRKLRRGIYVASKVKHAHMWRVLRQDGVPIISTWIDEAGDGETSDWGDLWSRCAAEASSAAVLLVYRERNENLKGALVEVGAAIAAGVPIIAVGDFEGHSWLNHPNVKAVATILEALRSTEGNEVGK